MKVRELMTSWGFKVDGKPLKDLDKSINVLKGTIGLIGGAAIAGAGAIFGLAKSTANAGDAIAKNAAALGVGADAYQRYSYAAELAGVEQSQFQIGLRTFVRQIGDAAQGTGEGARIFTDLGIRLKTAGGEARKSEDIMADLAESFKNTPDQAKKAAIATKLFGREGAKMTLMLNGGAQALRDTMQEASDFGNVLDADTLAASERLNDQLTQGRNIILGWKNILGAAMIPVVSEVIEVFKAWSVANRDLVKTKLTEFAKSLIKFTTPLVKVFFRIATALAKVIVFMSRFQNITKAVAIALGIIIALRAAYAIGKIGQGAIKAANGFIKMAKAINMATIKLWLIVAAVVAVIAIILLIIDDLMVFSRGGKSVFGLVFKAIENLFEKTINSLKSTWDGFIDGIVNDPRIQAIFSAMEWAGEKVEGAKEFWQERPKWLGGTGGGGGTTVEKMEIVVNGAGSPQGVAQAVFDEFSKAIDSASRMSANPATE